jgi:hypothetical protein
MLSLIGNPVQIRDGPAAVIPPFFRKGNLFSNTMPLFWKSGMGRPLKRRESQKTCLSYRFSDNSFHKDRRKIRVSRAELYVVEDFD